MLETNKRTVLTNYSYSVVLNFFKLAAPIIVIPFVYRQIAPTEMGRVNLAVVMMTYFYIAGDLGQYVYGIREISMVRSNTKMVSIFFTEMFVISLITNTLSAILFFIYIYFFSGTQIPHIYYYIASIQIFATFFNVEWMFEATENYKYIAIKTIIVRCITITGTLIFVRGNNAPEFYILFLSGFIFLDNLASFIIIQKHIIWYKGKLFLCRHIKNMFFIFVMINWTMLYFQLDKSIMGSNKDLVGVSYYTLSERVVALSSSFLISFIMVVTPRLGDKIGRSKSEYNELIQKILNVIFLFIFPLSFFLFASTSEILHILGGTKYVAAETILNVFVFYIIFYILIETAKSNILLLFKKEKIYFVTIIIGGIINFGIKLIWGNLMTAFDIILITLIIVSLIFTFIMLYCRYNLKINFLNLNAIKYLLMALPILLLHLLEIDSFILSLLLKSIIACIYYIGILLIIGDKNFLFIKKGILSKIKLKEKSI